jgi:hypothetical protein
VWVANRIPVEYFVVSESLFDVSLRQLRHICPNVSYHYRESKQHWRGNLTFIQVSAAVETTLAAAHYRMYCAV